MTILTAQQLSDLQAAKNAGQVLQYYTLLTGYGDAYGPLARSVADGTGVSGVVARGFAAAMAQEKGVSLEPTDWPQLTVRLMEEDFAARVAAGGAGENDLNLNYEAVLDYHVRVFAEFDLPPEAWTAYTPLRLAGSNASALWEDLKKADWVDQLREGASAAWGVLSDGVEGAAIAWVAEQIPSRLSAFFAGQAVNEAASIGEAAEWLRVMFVRLAAFADVGPGASVEAVSAVMAGGGQLIYGAGTPFWSPGILSDVFGRGPADDPSLEGGPKGDQIFGFSGDDFLFGDSGDDGLAGGSGSDTLEGGAGDDILIGGDQAFWEFLGTGADLATYAHAAGGVTLEMKEDPASKGLRVTSDGDGGGDILIGIEKIGLSPHSDRVVVKELKGNGAVTGVKEIDAGGSDNLGDELDLTAVSEDISLSNTVIGGNNGLKFMGFEVLRFGPGDNKVEYKEYSSEIYLGSGNDEIKLAGSGSRIWGESGSDTFHLLDNVRIEDAEAVDIVSYFGVMTLAGGFHWKGSVSPLAFAESLLVGYGRNKEGDLVIHDRIFGRDLFIRDYVGGPNADFNSAGIYVAEADVGAYRLFEPRPSHAGTMDFLDFMLGPFVKAHLGQTWDGDDPLVLDLDGDGLELVGQSLKPLTFDIDADGYGEPSGWVHGDDGLLVLDVNGDGQVADVSELFGGPGDSGFAELATHDANADGKIDAADAVFANLRVWRDLDQDRHVDAGELQTLAQSGVASIAVAGASSTATNNGNRILATGSFARADGTTGVAADVALVTDNQETVFLGDRSVSASAAALPELTGYGTLPDLRVAMTLTPSLQSVVSSNLAALDTLDLATMRSAVQPILTAWAQASPVTGRPPLLAHQDVPLLIKVVEGRESVEDFAYRQTDAVSGQTYWKLASGTAIHDASGAVIDHPTLEQVQADTLLGGAWSTLDGDTIAFFERYFGELLPLDATPDNPGAAAAAMSEVIDGLWEVLNAVAVRLAVQGPLADYFPGLTYEPEIDGFTATTPRQLIPSFEAIFTEVAGLGSGGLAQLAAWTPVLNVVIGDYHQPEDLLNTNGFLFSNIVAAYESVGLTLGVVPVAEALGLPADLIRTGVGLVTGGADADLFYLSAGDQTMSGGLGPDTYVVGRGFGHDVIDDLEPAGSAHAEDVVRFADVASTAVTAHREGLDLVITVDGTADDLRIQDHFDGRLPGFGGGGDLSAETGVDYVVFADGVTWDAVDVARAVSRPEAGAQTLGGTDTVDWLDGGGRRQSVWRKRVGHLPLWPRVWDRRHQRRRQPSASARSGYS